MHCPAVMADVTRQLESEKKTRDTLQEKMSTTLLQVEGTYTFLLIHTVCCFLEVWLRSYTVCNRLKEKVHVLHGFPADYERSISQLKSMLESKGIELEACKKMSHAKTLQIEMMEKTLHGM